LKGKFSGTSCNTQTWQWQKKGVGKKIERNDIPTAIGICNERPPELIKRINFIHNLLRLHQQAWVFTAKMTFLV
jgi:hypothetical protein